MLDGPMSESSPDAAGGLSSHDLRKKSVRGGMWAVLGAAGTAVASFATFLILSRLLGPKAYGLIAMVEASLALGQRVMSSGLSEPLIQMPRARPEHSDTVFWTLQGIGIAATAAMAGLSGLIGAYFQDDTVPALLAATSITLYFQACGLVPEAILSRKFRFSEAAQADVLSEIAGGCAGVSAALAGFGVWSLVAQRLVLSVVHTLVVWLRAGWRPRLIWSRECLQDVWKFSASRGVEGLLQFVDQQGARIILGRFVGATELGYYVFARRIVENTTRVLTTPIRTTAFTTFAYAQADLPRVRRIYDEGIALTAAAVFPVSVGIAVVAPFLVPIIAGPGWESSVVLLQLLMLATFRQCFHIWNAALMRGLGKPEYLLGASVVRTATILTLIFVLIPYGAVGTCIAVLCGSFLSWPVAMWFVRKVTGVGILSQLRPGSAAVASSILMGLILWFGARPFAAHLGLGPIPTIALLVGLGAAIYILQMSVVGQSEIASILRNLKVLLSRTR